MAGDSDDQQLLAAVSDLTPSHILNKAEKVIGVWRLGNRLLRAEAKGEFWEHPPAVMV